MFKFFKEFESLYQLKKLRQSYLKYPAPHEICKVGPNWIVQDILDQSRSPALHRILKAWFNQDWTKNYWIDILYDLRPYGEIRNPARIKLLDRIYLRVTTLQNVFEGLDRPGLTKWLVNLSS